MNCGKSLFYFVICIMLSLQAFSQSAYSFSKDWDQEELGTVESLKNTLQNLERLKKSKNPPSNLESQIEFAQAVQLYHLSRYSDAIPLFQKLLKDQFLLDDYVEYFLGLSYMRSQNLTEASKSFSKVVNSKDPSPRKLSARFRLGEIALLEKKYSLAKQHFQRLEKAARGSEKFPYVLWNLAKLHSSEKNNHRACKYVRSLYSKHPQHELLKDWTLELRNVELDGIKPGCLASLAEQKNRIRNLQYAGLSERARQEIQELYKRANEDTKFVVDGIYARFLVDDGDVDEALKILLPYSEQKSGDVSFLMQLGRAASRKGESPLAISAYLKVHRMNPRSSVGREALFQAAFVSYLNQDYDGALTRFQDYKKMYGGSNGVASAWYIAWIKYLKGDHIGSLEEINQFSKLRMSRKMKRQHVDPSRMQYWKAMNLLKLERFNEASLIFEKLSQDSGIGFYSIASKSRLVQIKDQIKTRSLSSATNSKNKPAPKIDLSPLSLLSQKTDSKNSNLETEEEILQEVKESEGETADSVEEDSEGLAEVDIGAEDSNAKSEVPDAEIVEQGMEEIVATFKDPRLQKGFQKAELLKLLGFETWSNRELQFIEARTRNKNYLQTLIEKYQAGNAYYRSSYIAEIYYSSERAKGLNPTNTFWRQAYPAAFEAEVLKASNEFGVSKSVIWSIMRTESFFRPTVKSNVGAMGLMQVMPLTGQKMADLMNFNTFQVPQLLVPNVNVRIGTMYLQRLQKMFDSSLPLVAAGYNAGPHRVYAWMKNFGNLSLDEFIEHIPFNQTRGYAKKVVRSYYIYASLYEQNLLTNGTLDWLTQPPKLTYSGPIPTKETWEPL